MKRNPVVVSCALVSVLAGAVLSAQTETPGKGTIVERVLVRVNGEIFTQSELSQKQVAYLREQNAAGQSDQVLQQRLAEATPALLNDAVNELLLVQRAREMGVTFTDDMFQRSLDNIKQDNNLDDEGLQAALKQEGMTLEQLRQEFERTYFVQAVQQREIGPSMTITQEEQRQYYAAHPDEFKTPETVTLRQLLVAVPSRSDDPGTPQNPALDAAAKMRIEGLRDQALGGADFAQLVKDNSDTPAAAKESGGLVGPVEVSDLNPALKDAILSLDVGGVSEPIRTQGGYQILQLVERAEPELKAFDAVRVDIEQAIRNERIGPETDRLLERLRKQAVIEWKDDTYRDMYTQYVAEHYADAGAGEDR